MISNGTNRSIFAVPNKSNNPLDSQGLHKRTLGESETLSGKRLKREKEIKDKNYVTWEILQEMHRGIEKGDLKIINAVMEEEAIRWAMKNGDSWITSVAPSTNKEKVLKNYDFMERGVKLGITANSEIGEIITPKKDTSKTDEKEEEKMQEKKTLTEEEKRDFKSIVDRVYQKLENEGTHLARDTHN